MNVNGDSPAPKPRPFPMRGPVRPASPAPTPAPDATDLVAARAFGRVDDEGRVWVKDTDGEREIGQFPDAVPDNPLDLYVHRYLDLVAQVDLFGTRLPHLNGREIDQALNSLREQVASPAAVGDLEGLRRRVEALAEAGQQRKADAAAERKQARETALERRTAIIAEARAIAERDPERTQWKQAGQRFRELLDAWKAEQRQGPHLDRAKEEELWKQFSSARTTFDRNRREYFTKLDAAQAQTKRTKEALIAEAERLSTSTDWGATSREFRDLMARWKQAGRASRRDDDRLWERFNAAQQRFFDARNAQNAAIDAEFAANLVLKEQLADEAEALLPVTDIEATRKALGKIQDRWDEIGMVPRGDRARVEDRMRAVEDALRAAEDEQWQRTDPETQARAQGMAGQLEVLIEELAAQIEAAKAAGDTAKVAELEENMTARQAWLAQIRQVTD